jgi:hypothetical protein
MSDTPSLTPPTPEIDLLAPSRALPASERARLRKAAARLLGLLLVFFVLVGPAGALRSWSLAVGIAAASLFGLDLITRLMVGAATPNATLWDRELRSRAAS